MARKSGGFEDKFLSKIGKIDPRRIREFLLQLLSRKNFFETVFDHLTEGIIVTDERLRMIYANRRSREMLRWRGRETPFGEDLAERCPPGDLRETLEAMRRTPRPIQGYECSLGPDEGAKLLLTAIPVRPSGGEAEEKSPLAGAMWVFILADDTERQKHLEAQARAQRLASLALLTSGVAHEIKNPLNSINLHAQILMQMIEGGGDEEEGIGRERVGRAARVILEESQRLEQIVNEFIQAARPQRAMMQPHYINHIITDLARLFESECQQRGIALELDLDPELPPQPLDSTLIFQALRNLVRNAIEAHTGEEEVHGDAADGVSPPAILLRTRIAADAMIIEVADNGPGIGAQALDKIFDPYYTTKLNGTGLGLMVVNRIIAEHRGTLRVESRPGAGTRFLITLPLNERPIRLLPGPEAAPAHAEEE